MAGPEGAPGKMGVESGQSGTGSERRFLNAARLASAVPGQPDDGTAQPLQLAAGEQGGTALL